MVAAPTTATVNRRGWMRERTSRDADEGTTQLGFIMLIGFMYFIHFCFKRIREMPKDLLTWRLKGWNRIEFQKKI